MAWPRVSLAPSKWDIVASAIRLSEQRLVDLERVGKESAESERERLKNVCVRAREKARGRLCGARGHDFLVGVWIWLASGISRSMGGASKSDLPSPCASCLFY